MENFLLDIYIQCIWLSTLCFYIHFNKSEFKSLEKEELFFLLCCILSPLNIIVVFIFLIYFLSKLYEQYRN